MALLEPQVFGCPPSKQQRAHRYSCTSLRKCQEQLDVTSRFQLKVRRFPSRREITQQE